jgi:Predicted multitransmembrane protein
MHRVTAKSAIQTGVILVVLLVYAAGAYLFCTNTTYYKLSGIGGGDRISYDKAQVVSIDAQAVHPDAQYKNMLVGSQDITVRMLSGAYKGREMKLVNGLNYDTNYLLKPGETIITSVNTTSDGKTVSIYLYGPDRTPWLFVIIGLFVLSLCAIGGRRGFRSVIGIAFTLVNVICLFIPMLYRGVSPALAVLIMAGITACITLLLTSGWHKKTAAAILGTIIGVGVSAGLLCLFEFLTALSGYNMSDYDTLLAISGHTGMKVDELLFAAIIISSLGAVMDIAISVATSVNEVFLSNRQATGIMLFKSGINVGRDMMGTMANTLILAFTGSSLNMLILIYTYNIDFNQIFNSNTIDIEIVQAISGSLAVILTVPLVSFISAKLLPLILPPKGKKDPDKLPPLPSQTYSD